MFGYGSLKAARAYHETRRDNAGAAVARSPDAWFDDVTPIESAPAPEAGRSTGTRRIKRRARRSYLSEALRTAGHHHAVPRVSKGKHDLSYINVSRRDAWKKYRVNAERHRLDAVWDLDRTADLTLERLVASFIQHKSRGVEVGQAEWDAPYRLTFWEASFLTQKGYGRKDLEAWAETLSLPDSLVAAAALASLFASSKTKPVPLFLLTYLLRRPYIKAHALTILLDIASETLINCRRDTTGSASNGNTVFILYLRLLRHAREVAPNMMPSIADMLLTYLPKASPDNIANLDSLTTQLNKAMHLISLQTAVNPFNDNTHQEAALVKVLRYMTEYQPQLQITREGYRAVVRIQLRQKKTASEQQWAELKALSWPPWKQDRTAMDAQITSDDHGITTAAATLRRMREAGYAATGWERTAALLCGWDVDGTPTVQTRALLGTGESRFQSTAAEWAARITATRTAQEAWAAYLAYEDAPVVTSDDVHFAILQKLYGEEKRQRATTLKESSKAEPALARQRDSEDEDRDRPPAYNEHAEGAASTLRPRLLPGDTQEVQPLPPSTHLYTYTRIPMPSVEGFVRHLQDRRISLRGHALGLAVANASRLRLGLWYLHTASADYPEISNLLSFDLLARTVGIPGVVFYAFVKLLCRYSNVPLNNLTRRVPRVTSAYYGPRRAPLLDAEQLNSHHPLVHVLELLRARGTIDRPPWNAVLQALTQDATRESIRFLRAVADAPTPIASEDTTAIDYAHSTLLASRLVRRVQTMLDDMHVHIDSQGFHCLCIATENTVMACWIILKSDAVSGHEVLKQEPMVPVRDFVRRRQYIKLLKKQFGILVGGGDTATSTALATDSLTLSPRFSPRLLHVPSAALLHAYVRALGWESDYGALLELVKWMIVHHDDLRAQHSRERNGRDLLRRTFTAIRVFLERSWLHMDIEHDEEADNGKAAGASVKRDGSDVRQDDVPTLRYLRRLEAAAPADLVEEVEGLVNGVEAWEGWPSDEEVTRYCRHERFERIRALGP